MKAIDFIQTMADTELQITRGGRTWQMKVSEAEAQDGQVILRNRRGRYTLQMTEGTLQELLLKGAAQQGGVQYKMLSYSLSLYHEWVYMVLEYLRGKQLHVRRADGSEKKFIVSGGEHPCGCDFIKVWGEGKEQYLYEKDLQELCREHKVQPMAGVVYELA